MTCLVDVNWFTVRKSGYNMLSGDYVYHAEFENVEEDQLIDLVSINAIKVTEALLLPTGKYRVRVEIKATSYIIENILKQLLNDD